MSTNRSSTQGVSRQASRRRELRSPERRDEHSEHAPGVEIGEPARRDEKPRRRRRQEPTPPGRPTTFAGLAPDQVRHIAEHQQAAQGRQAEKGPARQVQVVSEDREEQPPVDDAVRRIRDRHERVVELPQRVDGPIELGGWCSAESRSSHGQSTNRGAKNAITNTNAATLAAIGTNKSVSVFWIGLTVGTATGIDPCPIGSSVPQNLRDATRRQLFPKCITAPRQDRVPPAGSSPQAVVERHAAKVRVQ